MTDLMTKVIIIVMLFVSALQDIKQKQVSIVIILIGSIFIALGAFLFPTIVIMDRIGGVMVGGVVILISKVTGGKIGMGDGLILCATGLGIGLWANIELFAFALFLAASTAIILLILRKVTRKKSIPFIPFLFLSYICILVFSCVYL